MYYSVIKLKKNSEIIIGDKLLKVDSEVIKDKEVIGNDLDLIEGVEDNYCNWVSGGGTYLINNRYLVLVKRSVEGAVNPGKFSLFTGRSDDHGERLNPRGLVRELFEELVLFSGDKFLYPRCSQYQDVIDACYKNLRELNNFLPDDYIDFQLKEIKLYDRSIEMTNAGMAESIDLSWHINRFNDVNVLFLFSVDIDIQSVQASDAEYHLENDAPVFHNREVYLLDIQTNQLIGLSSNTQQKKQMYLNVKEDSTEHLAYMLDLVKGKVNLE